MPTIDELCEILHTSYEKAAADAGWQTQERSRVPWADVPEENKIAMRAAVSAIVPLIGAAALREAALRWKPLIDNGRRRGLCPTCQDRGRETVGMVCQTCGRDYGGS